MSSDKPDRPDELERIVADLQNGIDREENFRRLFDRYYQPVSHYFARRGFSLDECLDLTQEAFLSVFRSIGSFRGISSFETWLFGILANIYRNSLRERAASKRSANEVSLDSRAGGEGAGSLTSSEQPADPDDPGKQALRSEQIDLLTRAIGNLPPQTRRVLILRTYHSLSLREVARILGVSLATVKSQLYQGRRKLRDVLQ